jgi:hypothetical protein
MCKIKLFCKYLNYIEQDVIVMAWYFSEDCIILVTPEFDAKYSLNASHERGHAVV